MTLQIKKATKSESKLRMALVGPAGSGKTYTALSVGSNLAKRILVVDTETGSACKYADLFGFDVIELESFEPRNFVEAIRAAEEHNYELLIIDSLSHAWMGKGGILEMHGDAEKRIKNSFAAWRDVTPEHQRLTEAILQARCHVIATMRAKTDYSMDKDDKGRTQVKTVGLAPVQRDGMEYEFDVVAHLDIENNFIVQKTRCPALSGKIFQRAGAQVAGILEAWLEGVPQNTVVKMPEIKSALEKGETTPAHLRENETLVKDISAKLETLGKSEADFNGWFQREYQADMHWTQASLAVKRELLDRIGKWTKKAAA